LHEIFGSLTWCYVVRDVLSTQNPAVQVLDASSRRTHELQFFF
jgi:hypothetical protein